MFYSIFKGYKQISVNKKNLVNVDKNGGNLERDISMTKLVELEADKFQ
jgi:hypothetical protein